MEYLYWLSFRDPQYNKWLGGCFVLCDTPQNAIAKTHMLHINPGGEVVVTPGIEICDEILKMSKDEGYIFDHLYKTKGELPSGYERIPEELYD